MNLFHNIVYNNSIFDLNMPEPTVISYLLVGFLGAILGSFCFMNTITMEKVKIS